MASTGIALVYRLEVENKTADKADVGPVFRIAVGVEGHPSEASGLSANSLAVRHCESVLGVKLCVQPTPRNNPDTFVNKPIAYILA